MIKTTKVKWGRIRNMRGATTNAHRILVGKIRGSSHMWHVNGRRYKMILEGNV
jgi:hypothetical protein